MSRAIYDGDESPVLLKLNKKLHKFISEDARENFRSISMQVIYLLTQRMKAFQGTDSKETVNTPLYTESELQEIYKKQNGDD
tara:strand:+ start:1008 stop:1253 length:246 start_codon:yes stop_codon:yes gene_type:complete